MSRSQQSNDFYYPRLGIDVEYPLDYLVSPQRLRRETVLVRKAYRGNQTAIDELCRLGQCLILAAIDYFVFPPEKLTDAVQEGTLGLLRAIRRFYPGRQGRFLAFAWRLIWRQLQVFFLSKDYLCRIPDDLIGAFAAFRHDMIQANTPNEERPILGRWQASEPDRFHRLLFLYRATTPVAMHQGPPHELPEVRIYPEGRLDGVVYHEAIMSKLFGRRRRILIRRFGLDGEPESTLEDLGLELGVTRERVRQIESMTLKRLKRLLDLDGLGPSAVEPPQPVAAEPVSRRRPSPYIPKVDLTVKRDLDPDRYLKILLNRMFPKQELALRHYYGLLGSTPLPLDDVAQILGTSIRYTANALKRGTEKLCLSLSLRTDDHSISILRRVRADTAWSAALVDSTQKNG